MDVLPDVRRLFYSLAGSNYKLTGPDLWPPIEYPNEPPHDKTNKMVCAPREDSDQPGHPTQSDSSEPSLSTRRKIGSLATH